MRIERRTSRRARGGHKGLRVICKIIASFMSSKFIIMKTEEDAQFGNYALSSAIFATPREDNKRNR